MHNEIVMHKCPNCIMKFREYSKLLEHFNDHSGMERIKCESCPKWFRSQDMLSNHERIQHKYGYQIICPDCGNLSKSKQCFTIHFRAEHMKDYDDRINCKLCHQTFPVRPFSSFVRHLGRFLYNRVKHAVKNFVHYVS